MISDFGTLGFGFLRLPHIDPDDSRDVDIRTAAQMVDLFLQRYILNSNTFTSSIY